MGEVCQLPIGLKCCMGQRMVLLRPDPEQVVGRFLLFALQSRSVQHQIGVHEGTGSTVSNLRIPALKTLQVPWFPLPEQRRIAAVLGALDDKIELNRRMNRTLEEMAQALFKSWFIDFDGVPPEDLVDSELGLIPKGWSTATIQEIAEVTGGKQLDRFQYDSAGEFPIFGANGPMGRSQASTHGGFVVAFGRVGAYCGSIHWTSTGAWINNNASAIEPISAPYYTLQSLLNFDWSTLRSGSAQPFISQGAVQGVRLIRPDTGIVLRFDEVVGPMRSMQESKGRESNTLAQLRDTLLPKLISGEIRVPEAEEAVESAL